MFTKKMFQNMWVWLAGVILITSILYFSTMPHFLTGYNDSDLFLTLAHKLGLPMPSGYAFYTLLLNLFTKIPLPFNSIVKGHALSVLLSVATVGIVFLSTYALLLKSRFTYIALGAAAVASISLALSSYFWLLGQNG